MKSKKIQRLLILAVTGLLVVVLTVTVSVFMKNNGELRSILHDSVKSELISISIAAREIIDVERFITYRNVDDILRDQAAYDMVLSKLRQLQENVGATYIYALAEIDGEYFFIFDTDTEEVTLFDEYEDLSQVHLDAFMGIESAGIMNVTDQWGSFNTGAVPIWLEGRVVGIVSTDIEDHFIRAGDQAAAINILILVCVLLTVMFANVLIIRRLVVRPLKRLTDSVSATDMNASEISCAKRNDEFGVLARTIQGMWNNVLLRDQLLITVNESITLLLQADVEHFEDSLWRSMGMISRAVRADRMYIWKKREVDGKLYCTQLYEWSEGAAPQQGNEYTVDIPYDENIPGWEQRFRNNQSVNNMVRNMSPEEQAQLAPQGIVSILVVPVYLKEEFWGFVGFDDCHRERLFTEIEESVLRAGSLLIANALLRNDMTVELESALLRAQEASRAKSDFLANMSHEMRTPLNGVIGMAQIALGAADPKQKEQSLIKINQASKHLLGVINNILDYSKIEADKFDLSISEFDFEQMMRHVYDVIAFAAEEKQQALDVVIDADIPRKLIGDEQRIAQVIANLLSNAVKFTPDGGRITASAHVKGEADGRPLISVEVSDTGIGISEEQRSRLFRSFEQADNTITKRFGGTGLGLAISKSIVEAMGGTVIFESELGKGSTFGFIIPLERAPENTMPADTTSLSGAEDEPADNFSGRHILLVDDVALNREIILTLLEPTNVTIDTADNGAIALEMFTKDPDRYDMILMDIQMPVMDGYEATQRIRSLDTPRAKTVPIIAITANAFRNDRD